MNNIINFHPVKSPLFTFYEVVEGEGDTRWGGDTAFDALTWLRLAPVGSRVLVSAWDAEGEDAHIVGQPIDITDIILEAQRIGR